MTARAAARDAIAAQVIAGLALQRMRASLPEARGQTPGTHRRYVDALDDCGIGYRTARKWQRMADAARPHLSDDAPDAPGLRDELMRRTEDRDFLEAVGAMPRPRKQQAKRKVVARKASMAEAITLSTQEAQRLGYVPVAGPFAAAEAGAFARTIGTLHSHGARVAIVGAEIWRAGG